MSIPQIMWFFSFGCLFLSYILDPEFATRVQRVWLIGWSSDNISVVACDRRNIVNPGAHLVVQFKKQLFQSAYVTGLLHSSISTPVRNSGSKKLGAFCSLVSRKMGQFRFWQAEVFHCSSVEQLLARSMKLTSHGWTQLSGLSGAHIFRYQQYDQWNRLV